jgi:hypothetical protein
VIGLHFFNPVPVLPLVELVPSLMTSPETEARASGFATDVLGKDVIRSKDRAGFVVNALLIPYLLSAIRMLESGFATAADIDAGMVHGCAHPMGPLALTDLIGLDTTMAVAESMYSEFKEPLYAPPPLLSRMVEAGLLGRKSARGFHEYAGSQPCECRETNQQPVLGVAITTALLTAIPHGWRCHFDGELHDLLDVEEHHLGVSATSDLDVGDWIGPNRTRPDGEAQHHPQHIANVPDGATAQPRLPAMPCTEKACPRRGADTRWFRIVKSAGWNAELPRPASAAATIRPPWLCAPAAASAAATKQASAPSSTGRAPTRSTRKPARAWPTPEITKNSVISRPSCA